MVIQTIQRDVGSLLRAGAKKCQDDDPGESQKVIFADLLVPRTQLPAGKSGVCNSSMIHLGGKGLTNNRRQFLSSAFAFSTTTPCLVALAILTGSRSSRAGLLEDNSRRAERQSGKRGFRVPHVSSGFTSGTPLSG